MKNQITQLALVFVAFVAFTLLMSYARPAADEPKEYTLVFADGGGPKARESFRVQVNEKLGEGWHLQGGVAYASNSGTYMQAMVK